MTRRSMAAFLVLACTTLVGCGGVNYQGGWNFGASEEEAAQRAAAMAKLQRENERRWAEAAERERVRRETLALRTAQANFDGGGEAADVGDGTMPVSTQPPTSVSQWKPADQGATTAKSVRRSAPPINSFGGLDGQPGPTTSSWQASSNMGQITFAMEGGDFDPAIDPTGQWIAFASTRHRETSDIYLQKIGGSSVRQLTSHTGKDARPCFSPDGKSIAFCSDRNGNWDIYIVDLDGGKPRQITSGATHDIHPSFSPDGRQLVYSSYGSRSGQWELWVVDVENTANRTQVYYGLFPHWSPTGNKIVFQKARNRGTRWFSIWTIDLVNGEARNPTEIAAASNAAVITPRWSPDGKQVVFATVVHPDSSIQKPTPRQADIWLMDEKGQYRSNLTQSPFADSQPVWGPDGKIYFVSNRGRGGIENIWSQRIDQEAAIVKHKKVDGPATAIAPDNDEKP